MAIGNDMLMYGKGGHSSSQDPALFRHANPADQLVKPPPQLSRLIKSIGNISSGLPLEMSEVRSPNISVKDLTRSAMLAATVPVASNPSLTIIVLLPSL
jgi:hypothetical protein